MNSFVPTLLLASTMVCGSGGAAPDEVPVDAEPPPTAPGEASAPAGLDATAFAPVLEKYELVRASLARDDANVAANATALVDAIESTKAPAGKDAAELDPLRNAARRLSTTSADDIAAVRRGFGEVSKAMVEFLVPRPELRAKIHVFECPMAESYKKWIQPNESLENPYMGTKMSNCGSKSQWSD